MKAEIVTRQMKYSLWYQHKKNKSSCSFYIGRSSRFYFCFELVWFLISIQTFCVEYYCSCLFGFLLAAEIFVSNTTNFARWSPVSYQPVCGWTSLHISMFGYIALILNITTLSLSPVLWWCEGYGHFWSYWLHPSGIWMCSGAINRRLLNDCCVWQHGAFALVNKCPAFNAAEYVSSIFTPSRDVIFTQYGGIHSYICKYCHVIVTTDWVWIDSGIY
jgi:hypothetical protein